MKKFYSFIFSAFLGILIFQGTSCKGPQPCNSTVTVLDSAGVHPLAGVAVHLYANIVYNGKTYTGDLKADGVTNTAGQASFTIKNPCILDIRATVPNCTSNPSYSKYCLGTGIIRFDAGQNNSSTVYVNQ